MGRGGGEDGLEICCKAIIAILIAAGLTALFIWVGLRGFQPKCFLRDLQIPAVAANSTADHTANFTLILYNRNRDTGIYYDPLNLTFSYKPPATAGRISPVPVGSAAVPGFHQGGGKEERRDGSFGLGGGGGWVKEAAETARAAGKVGFRVELKTEIRYKIVLWKTKRHRMEVGADVAVDGAGGLVFKRGLLRKKGIRLTSAAAGVGSEKGGWSGPVWVVLASWSLLLLF